MQRVYREQKGQKGWQKVRWDGAVEGILGALERCNPRCVLGENSVGFGVEDWFLRLSFDHWRGRKIRY